MSVKRRDSKNRVLRNGESPMDDMSISGNKAQSGMNPKTLQYLMGHSELSVTMDTYTHLGLQDAWNELERLQLQFSQQELGLKLVKTA